MNVQTPIATDKLVSTEWLADNLDAPNIRIIESNEDPLLYPSGHIPGALEIDWVRDLNDPLVRDYVGKEAFAALMSRCGIGPETTVVFYGDKSNWWACYSLWVFELFGHTNTKILDGGRLLWEQEGRPLTREVARPNPTMYVANDRDDRTQRAFREDVLSHIQQGLPLVDVRSPQEFSGEALHMPGYPQEGALRGGHIPGAKSVPWARATDPTTGKFLSAEQLQELYCDQQGLDPNTPTVAYCRIGERSSHTWFVLRHILGFQNVRNYDGSWTEWGNSVGVPIER
ncbi:MAG: sulfurtransferase [Chthonomonas sp.]|nr:sulfurtransferase [Chthonomonas sp.]